MKKKKRDDDEEAKDVSMESANKKGKGKEEKSPAAKEAAVELGARLDVLREEALEGCCFKCADVVRPEDLERVRQALDRFGVVFLTEAVEEVSVVATRARLNDAMWEMFHFNLEPGTPKPASLQGWNALRNSAYGFGNTSFSYINKQFTAAAVTPHTRIGSDDKVYMTTNSVWTRVNLPLLLDNPHACALLLSLTHVNGMISIDSTKYASNPRPKPKTMTKETLTEPHVDLYDEVIQRCQAMVVVEENVKLGYVAGTHHLLKQMAAVTENKAFMAGSGYIGCRDPDLKALLTRGWIAPPSRSLVIWRSGVVHFEASTQPAKLMSGPHVFRSWNDMANQERLRVVVGTHLPVGLSRDNLIQIAVMAECGAIPDFYRKINKHCKLVYPNLVNSKTTQFLVARKLEASERKFIEDATAEGAKGEAAAVWQALPPLKRHLFGVSQPLESLPFSESDRLLLQHSQSKE